MEKLPSGNKILLYKNLLKSSKIISIFDPLFYDFTVIQIKSAFKSHRKLRDSKILKKEIKKCKYFLEFLSEFQVNLGYNKGIRSRETNFVG